MSEGAPDSRPADADPHSTVRINRDQARFIFRLVEDTDGAAECKIEEGDAGHLRVRILDAEERVLVVHHLPYGDPVE